MNWIAESSKPFFEVHLFCTTKPVGVVVTPFWEITATPFLCTQLKSLRRFSPKTADLEVNYGIDKDRYNCEIWIPVIEKHKRYQRTRTPYF